MKIQAESLNLVNVFFEALDYPEYARPEFFVQKQKQSEWSRGIYLTTLSEIYFAYIQILEIKFGAKKRDSPGLSIDDFKVSPKEISEVKTEKSVTKKELDDLHLAIQAAGFIDRPSRTYTPFQILSFAEAAIIFIREQFREQAKKSNDLGFRPRTNTYFTYLIAQDAPFFDFPKFKAAVRELLLTSPNVTRLSKILEHFHKACNEIVKLWNEDIYFLEQKAHKKENAGYPERVMVEFHGDTLKYSWWNSEELFRIRSHDFFLNQHLAYYAANIANLINSDLLRGQETKINVRKKDFINDFLRGIRHLMDKHEKEVCISKLLEGDKHEGPFRDYFWRWFEGQGYALNSESQRGNKHIDLKAEHPSINRKIIEFKGWWNKGRNFIIPQLFNYLTDFEGDGYIFIINHTRKPIVDAYQKMITGSITGLKKGTWRVLTFKPTAFNYFSSEHQFNGQPKTIYHFIINIHLPVKK
jgi:hypothetical protein